MDFPKDYKRHIPFINSYSRFFFVLRPQRGVFVLLYNPPPILLLYPWMHNCDLELRKKTFMVTG